MKPEEKTATAAQIMERLSGGKEGGFSIVLTGDSAYTPEELENTVFPVSFTRQDILDIVIIRYALNTNSFQKYMPVTIATNVSEESVAAIMERKSQLQGIEVVEDSIRQYIDDESMAPILGYIGRASAEELESLRKDNPDYANDAVVGKAGIEQYMELTLHGTDGVETVTVDNLGKVLKIEDDTKIDPIAGNDVYLTIDSEWQSAIYQILKQRVAGILLSKIEAVKTFDYEAEQNAARIIVPIYDVYNALVKTASSTSQNSARPTPRKQKKIYMPNFSKKQQQVFDTITERLTSDNPPAFQDEDKQMQEYMTYICDTLLRDTLQIISKRRSGCHRSFLPCLGRRGKHQPEGISHLCVKPELDRYFQDLPEGEYLDSSKYTQALTAYLVDYLKTDIGFSKLLYEYMLQEGIWISGQELCLVLYEQGVLSKEGGRRRIENLASGATSAYDFMINKIWSLEIEPADLALMPCSASAVVTDVHTGDVSGLRILSRL